MTAHPYHLKPVQTYNRLMSDSFHRLNARAILADATTDTLTDAQLAEALFYAPEAIVSHGTEPDPVFRYANARALELWGMDWDSFTRLPSRLSAETDPSIQTDRNTLLASALEKGAINDYSGIRISATGKRFRIRDTVLWNVSAPDGTLHGQAALIGRWDPL